MAEAGAETDRAADRLEAALERIAALSSRHAASSGATPPGTNQEAADMPARLTDRLDALIATLRQALDGPTA